jgi:hypothetical protein
MRSTLLIISAIVVIVLSLMPLTACKSQPTTTSPSSTDPRFSPPLTLEQAEQRLKETGSTLVDTVDKASRLTGYPVAIPAFVPEGFAPWVIAFSSTFDIHAVGFSSPNYKPSAFPYDVQQYFAQTQGLPVSKGPFFTVTQSRNKIRSAGGELTPVDIGSHPGEKMFIPASGNNTVRLGLSWNDGTMYYVMEATLTGPLDETTLIKIASSMGVP